MSSDESSEAEEVGDDLPKRNVDMVALRKDLADLPMGELSTLKDKVGLKTYNEVLFGATGSTEKNKKKFSRANKNRPSEVSSKKRVSSFREVFPQKKKVTRDPRFDDLSGAFNEEHFRKSYSFLSDMKDNEIQVLRKKLKKTSDSDKKAKIKQLIDRMEQQQKNEKTKQVQQEKKREWKKHEQEQVKQGKKPFYVKQSALKQQDLVEKYKELKESGRLKKYMEKKRKKNTSKDRKRLPSTFS